MGGLGCAIAIAGALFLGQGLIMNVYYQKKQHLDIISFWKEILKMSIVPIIVCICSMGILYNIELDSWSSFSLAVIIFIFVYVPLFYHFSMNQSERDLFVKPIVSIIHKFKR